MDRRSTFLRHPCAFLLREGSDGVTLQARSRKALAASLNAIGGHSGKSGCQYSKGVRRAKALLRDRCQEPRKAPSKHFGCPYRKPTQVGEERILRRSSDSPLRNSANWFRNFGRRNACFGQAPRGCSLNRSQRNGPSDCLPKTQDCAKS